MSSTTITLDDLRPIWRQIQQATQEALSARNHFERAHTHFHEQPTRENYQHMEQAKTKWREREERCHRLFAGFDRLMACPVGQEDSPRAEDAAAPKKRDATEAVATQTVAARRTAATWYRCRQQRCSRG